MRPDLAVQEAITALNQGREDDARALLASVLKARPTEPNANKLMAMIHGAHHEDEKALLFLQRSVIGNPRDGEVRFMMGNVLLELKRYKEAAAAYREALKIAPGNVASSDGLGKCLISLGQYHEAERVFRSAIAANPENADAYGNMGGVLVAIAKMREALDVGLEGLRRLPGHPALLEFIAYTMNFPQGVDPVELRVMHERVGAVFASQATRQEPVLTNDPDPDRPLRVGFLSGDYSLHACAMFMKGPLLHFDRAAVIPYCFSTSRKNDGGDEPFKRACEWRDISELDTNATGAAILADRIDILVECSGLTEGHRLKALTPRTAPIQCTWLGYPNTTGLPTMDYRIIDAITDPPGSEHHCTEKLARMPGCFLCFTPDANTPEPVLTAATASPDSTAPITFGSFNRMTKVTPETIDTWCGVLAAVPGSRILLKLRIMSDELRRDTVELFTARGIAGDRVEMVPFTKHSDEHAAMYSRMDIALDAFPYNGTTTTCEATWMGVPVVVLEGDTHRSRVGMSLSTALGLPELIARNRDEYVAIAAGLARDRAGLARLKLSLRGRMAASPLCHARRYASNFENLLRVMWRDWCSRRGGG